MRCRVAIRLLGMGAIMSAGARVRASLVFRRIGGRVAVGVLTTTALVMVAAPIVSAAPFEAKASVAPQFQPLNDTAGTVFTFTVHNTGTSASIGAVEIVRPSNRWTVAGCPRAPAGWSAQRSDAMCRFRSGDGTADDIQPGQTLSAFQVRATTLPGSADRVGTWAVTVSKSNLFDSKSLLTAASAEPPGLGVAAHSWEILDALVDGSPSTPGGPCPTATPANHSAITGSTGHTIVLCGKNRMSVSATPQAGRSSLAGTFIASAGSFTSASIAANSASSVVLGQWSNVTITSAAGTGKTIVAKTGSASNQTSALTTLTGYEATNQPPVANSDIYAVNEGGTLNVATPGVLGNDTDAENDSLTAVLVTGPANAASFALNLDGSFIYVHDGSETTSDSFTYRANDGMADSNVATVIISINPVNDAPVATDDIYAVNEGGTLNVAAPGVLGNDTDAENDSLTAVLVTGPANAASFALNLDGSFIYVHDGSETTSDSFTYRANDGMADSNVATVIISINPVNDGLWRPMTSTRSTRAGRSMWLRLAYWGMTPTPRTTR